ncbi:putative ribonuclease H-like domain-containing protein [Tanacetum coccineum]|uniref:Ribonuclease H-like domain-containing protein n=1 Tax=Tanacetum coccineum TaxID=301880 RepID=A0ABQ5HW40_9ASTR
MAPIASSDTEVKTYSKNYLKNYEALKKQYDDLLVKLSDTGFKAATYKRGLDNVEAQLVTYRKNEVLFSEEVVVLKRELKDLSVVRKSDDKIKKGFGYCAVPPPHPLIYNIPNKLNLSYYGLEEFQQHKFEVYGLRANESVCENSSNETKKNSDAPLIKEWVSDNEDEVESPVVVEKKTVVPTIPKVDVVRPKQQEKPVRKTVRARNNQKSQQLGSDFVMIKKACYVCGSFEHLQYTCDHSNPRRNMIPQAVLMRSGIKAVNTAKPKDAHNAVKRNRFNTVKASACWVWMPKNRVIDHGRNNAQIDEDHFGSDGCTDSGEAGVQPKTKDNDERQRISRAEGLKTAGYKVTTAGSRLLLLVKKLMLLVQEVIEFGNSYKTPPEETGKGVEGSTKKKGRIVAITAEDMQKQKNDVKARITLLLALPNEHQLQAIVSHLEFMDVPIEQDDLNQKFLTSLAPEWLVYTIVWRNRDDLDIMSLDDVYNHLKVYEPEVQKRAGSNSQNMGFISSSNTSSRKSEVSTTQGVSTASVQVPTASTDVAAASFSYDTVCAFIATQPNGSQIKNEDITQIDDDDIEEMDIKWNLALLSIRADRFWKKTGKKITIQGSDVAGFDKSKVECFNCHKMGYFARDCRSPRSQDRGKKESYKKDPTVEEPTPKAMIAIDGIG